jgi:histidyl-tRNA synthetase
MATKKETTPNLQSAKGMRDIMGDEFYYMQGFFEKAQEVAMYYGFDPIMTPILEHEEVFTRSIGDGTDTEKEMYRLQTKGGDKLAMRPEKTASVMRAYIEHGMRAWSQPIMFYNYGPVFRHDKPQKGRYRQFHQFDLDILGSEKPVSDAIIIQTAMVILKEVGAENLMIEINSIGDKESRNEYEKALRAYYKKFVNKLPAVDRDRLKNGNVLRILDSKEEATKEINLEAPSSVDFLSNAAKRHFKEVLSHLDELDIPYRMNKNLVRGLDYYTDTVFEVVEVVTDEEGNERTHAICGGGRYNYLANSMGHKKEVPAVGVAFGVERIIEAPWWNKLMPRIMKAPKVYFIQLGFEAKLKSLAIMEILRKAKVPIIQALTKDKLSIQLAEAEKLGVDQVLIFGQREAIDKTVIVRDVEKQSQKSVKISELADYLKKAK